MNILLDLHLSQHVNVRDLNKKLIKKKKPENICFNCPCENFTVRPFSGETFGLHTAEGGTSRELLPNFLCNVTQIFRNFSREMLHELCYM